MATGTVSVSDPNKGYVIITPRDGSGDITVDWHDLQAAGLTDLKVNDGVTFDEGADGRIHHLRRG
ncbi:cold-shock protein [Pseudomonas reactans]|uniref:cold-shock protein n=1 Tax=Pseudomonas reactans TaxID=117680 RepID=UPI0015BF3D72|nr:cold shock domain-containing protein [Pseudomonas reactans]NWD84087.1 cold-shock protein [Pseudomonas reactans]